MNWPFQKRIPAKPEQQLQWEIQGDRLAFSLAAAQGIEWVIQPPASLSEHDSQRCRVLGQWLMDGIAEATDEQLMVELARFYLTDEGDRQALQLAPPSRFRYQLQAKGTLHEPDVSLVLTILDKTGMPQVGLKHKGCFLGDGVHKYLLSEPEYAFLCRIEAFANRSDEHRTYDEQLRLYAQIKRALERLDNKLDHYLQSETAVVPEQLGIDVVSTGEDEIEVRPVLLEIESERLGRALDTYRNTPDVLTLQQSDGARQRLVLEPDIQEGLTQIKGVRKLRGKAKRDFLARPQDYLDATKVNLEDFSERVAGIGHYEVRYYPLITQSDRSWIPESIALVIASSNPEQEPIAIPFGSLDDFSPLETAYQKATEQKEAYFNWQTHELPIDGDTEPTLSSIKKALELRQEYESRPTIDAEETVDPEIALEEASEEQPENNFLLIHSNEEDSLYLEKTVDALKDKLVLARPKSLLDEIQILPHQAEGIAWIQSRFKEGARGVILADDMGLGKTLQALTFLAWYAETNPDPLPILVVAPVALLENWRDEYHKFLTSDVLGEPLPLHGSYLAEFKLRSGGGREYQHEGGCRLLDVERLAQHRLVLTTYETVRDYQFSLASIHWGIIVTDEAQKIKTPGALVTNACKALKTDFRIVATGTPVENSLVDLWCLMDFAQPGLLGALKTFRSEFDQPRDRQQDHGEANAQRLRERIDPAFLRRLKVDILKDLPPRIEHDQPIPMSSKLAERYLRETEAFRAGSTDHSSILTMLARLRALSCHPALLEEEEQKVNLKSLPMDSPKLQWVIEQLSQILKAQEKCVLFTEDRRLQRLLAQLIQEVFGISPAIVNGTIPGSSTNGVTRKFLIDRFQEQPGFNTIILSPVAVGYGLTITAANHVIHVTRLWNPAKEDQATDRLHRIGQTKDVHIHYPMAIDPHNRFLSFDQILATLLSQKRQMARNVLYPTDALNISQEVLARLLLSHEKTDASEISELSV